MPTGKTSEQLKALPEIVSLEDWGATPVDASPWSILLGKSLGNLQHIGLALQNYFSSNRGLPHAVLIGPDGKPWHSWRVLLLPQIEPFGAYDAYRWDEPWDGPNNRKLLSKMPAEYADPIYGENKEFYTNYVAVTGEGMMFSAQGAKFDGSKASALAAPQGRNPDRISDGASNTLMVGHVGFDRKIPWMKPEDIEVTDNLPKFGKKGGFGLLPYKTKIGLVSPFLRGDGFTFGIAESIDDKLLHSLFTVSGGEKFDWSAVPCLGPDDLPKPSVEEGSVPVIYLVRVDGEIKARLVIERPK